MKGSGQNSKQGGRPSLCRRALWFAIFALFLLPGLPAFSQGAGSRGWGFGARGRLVAARQQGRNGEARPGFFRRLRDLPPKEQERVLANDKRFQSLPRERQKMIRENLRRWNQLSPQRKQQLRERAEIFARLTPAQRQEARGIFREWRELGPLERRKILRAFRMMRDLPPGERGRFLASPRVRERFSPHERNMLRKLGKLLPPQEPAKEDTGGS